MHALLITASSMGPQRQGCMTTDETEADSLFRLTILQFENQAASFDHVNDKVCACIQDLRRVSSLISNGESQEPLDSLRQNRVSILVRCNRLELVRLEMIEEIRLTIGQQASVFYDYYDLMEKISYRKLRAALKQRKNNWRRIAMLKSSLRYLEHIKDILIEIFEELVSFGFRTTSNRRVKDTAEPNQVIDTVD